MALRWREIAWTALSIAVGLLAAIAVQLLLAGIWRWRLATTEGHLYVYAGPPLYILAISTSVGAAVAGHVARRAPESHALAVPLFGSVLLISLAGIPEPTFLLYIWLGGILGSAFVYQRRVSSRRSRRVA